MTGLEPAGEVPVDRFQQAINVGPGSNHSPKQGSQGAGLPSTQWLGQTDFGFKKVTIPADPGFLNVTAGRQAENWPMGQVMPDTMAHYRDGVHQTGIWRISDRLGPQQPQA